MLKNNAYSIGIKISVMSVPKVSPPMILAANDPNIESESNGIIPRIVVNAAILTARKRLWALSISAVIGSTPLLSCSVI